MGNIIKLKNAGESVTWHIAKAETTAGNFGPQVKFESSEGEILYLPADSAERQLSRIPLSVAECIGETLVISRDPNPKPGAQPFWGIKLAGAAEKQPPSKRLSYAEAAKPSGPSKGSIPEMDNFPSEEYVASIHWSDGADPYLEPPRAPTPHRVPTVPTKAADTAPIAAKRAALFDEYMSLTAMVRKHSGHTSDDAIQATTFSIFKMWKDGGLV